MKDSEVYLRAAELVAEKNDFTCNVVWFIGGSRARNEYSDLFASKRANKAMTGEGYLNVKDVSRLQNPHEWRTLALCFMAAIAASEGR